MMWSLFEINDSSANTHDQAGVWILEKYRAVFDGSGAVNKREHEGEIENGWKVFEEKNRTNDERVTCIAGS